MKILKQGLSLALLTAGLTALPGLQVGASGLPAPAPDRPLVQQMRAAADGAVRVTNESATGKIGFVAARGAQADLLPDVAGNTTAKATAKATAYLDRFGAAFGAADGQLKQSDVKQDPYGWTVTYTQQYRGVDVFGSMLKANLDQAGDLTSISGYAAPDLDLSVDPRVSAAEAGERAVGTVKDDPVGAEKGGPSVDTSGLEAVETELVVYRMGALKGETGEAVLAYVVEVTNAQNIRDMVFVDAATNKVINRYSILTEALDRELREASLDDGGTPDDESDDRVVFETVWKEGDLFPGALTPDQQNLVNSAGESYWMYENTFGRDSYDGEGAKMITVNNDPRISCPNANWNGVTTNYCDGVTSDDVVSHEWGHAYTEYTSGLIYQYQSGALNEAYSDVWGETLDLVNGREDEGEGDISVKRPDGLCSTSTRGNVSVIINSPTDIAGPCEAAPASFGPVVTKAGVTSDLVVGQDAPGDGSPTNGCGAFTNAAAIAGKFVYVDRGVCTFAVKASNAEAAGATGIIIGNNIPGDAPFSPSGDADIYGAMIDFESGAKIKGASGTVNITLKDIDTAEKADSRRWLVGEQSTAFGGAIRDMWNPTCYGDPGKVTDAEYDCDPELTDSGGVHGNSGVPNHAYALMVDGGTFNGQTIAALGLDQAANVWWRAQSSYLTPSSNFVDAADALEQSCTDLVGEDINVVTTEANATPELADPITAADCVSVANAMTATEMRTKPVQCNFKPLLAKNAPGVCGKGTKSKTLFKENFEDGLAGWKAEQELADLDGYQGGFGRPWVATDAAPGSHPGGVAFAPAGDLGDCSGDGVNDFSSRDSITGPTVSMPKDAKSPRMSFEHYVATEGGFDGGNVKYSLNGKAFQVIPASAYTFNAPGELTSLEAGNTSPIAGEPGFTGTDGGEVTGSWGQSQVNLKKLGAKGGDKIALRFDMGRDGCGGIEGWAVDNVTIVACEKKGARATSKMVANAPRKVAFAANFFVRVKSKVPGRGDAFGAVKVFDGKKVIARGKLRKGVAKLKVTRNLAPGKQVLSVKYLGNKRTKTSTDKVTVRIVASR